MKLSLIICLVIMAACIMLSRFISEKGLKLLHENEKARLVDSLSRLRIFSIIPPLLIAAAYFVGLKFFKEQIMILVIIFLVLLISYTIGLNIISYQMLKKEGLPRVFIQYFIGSRLISTSGIILLIAVFFVIDI